MRQLPQRRIRRNFTLDPALYGRPQREPLVQAYPVLRTATALAAFLFIFVIAANLFLGGSGGTMPAAEPALAPVASSEQMIVEAPVEEAPEEIADEALMLEEEAEAPAFEEVPVDSALEAPLAEAESGLEAEESEAGLAVPLDRDSLAGKPETDAAVEESAPVPAPTQKAAEVADAIPEPDMSAEAVEFAAEPTPRELEETNQQQIEEAVGAGFAAEGDAGPVVGNNLSLVAVILGVILLVLLILTLLARRRL
jgi:hypothetical protein